jgi:hypothetical protein
MENTHQTLPIKNQVCVIFKSRFKVSIKFKSFIIISMFAYLE